MEICFCSYILLFLCQMCFDGFNVVSGMGKGAGAVCGKSAYCIFFSVIVLGNC